MNVTYAPSIERMIGLWERDCAASAAMHSWHGGQLLGPAFAVNPRTRNPAQMKQGRHFARNPARFLLVIDNPVRCPT